MDRDIAQVQRRIDELEQLAAEIMLLAERLRDGDASAQPDLLRKGQRWYRGAREVLAQQEFSGLDEFDQCYDTSKRPDSVRRDGRPYRWAGDIEMYIRVGTGPGPIWSTPQTAQEYFGTFAPLFNKARSLLVSVTEEIASRATRLQIQLSFAVSADELDKAEALLNEAGHDEVFIRASGVIARVALERHLFTLAESRNITIVRNPPHKKKSDVEDVLQALKNNGIITAVQKSQFDHLFKIATNCAHPKEIVVPDDVRRLILEGRQLASTII